MFNVGGGEILVILLLALLVLGPDKLPEYARKAGRYMNEFRRLTGGFQEEFRQAMDLGGTASSPSSDPADPAPSTSSDDDAIHRTTEGPRLLPRADAAPLASPPPPAPSVGSSAGSASTPTTPDPSTKAAFAADVTPAPGTGPELITPPRPSADHGGDPGSTSAA
jgi:sec-independent protein translocase protein TatB